MSETGPKNVSQSCSNTFLVLQVPLLLYFAFFILRKQCLAMFAGSGMVRKVASYGAAWLRPFGKLANERYWDQHHLATSGPVISWQTASLLGRLSLRYQTANAAKTFNKNGFRLINRGATFFKSAKIMIVLSNYEKNYASTIYKSLVSCETSS